jgi:hypothetical protein
VNPNTNQARWRLQQAHGEAIARQQALRDAINAAADAEIALRWVCQADEVRAVSVLGLRQRASRDAAWTEALSNATLANEHAISACRAAVEGNAGQANSDARQAYRLRRVTEDRCRDAGLALDR